MQIKPLRGMVGEYGTLRRNQVASVPDHIGKKLIKRGLAEALPKGAGGKAAGNPSRSRRGGRTGKAKQS